MNPDLNQKEIPAGAEADALLELFLEEHGVSHEVARHRVIPFVQNDEELLGAFHSAQLLDTSDEPFETKIAEQAYNIVAARGGIRDHAQRLRSAQPRPRLVELSAAAPLVAVHRRQAWPEGSGVLLHLHQHDAPAVLPPSR